MTEMWGSRISRGIDPTFADTFQPLIVAGAENVSVPIATPALAAGASAVVSGSQGLKTLSSVAVTASDIGHAIFANTSVVPPPNVLPGHPTIQITTVQGTPIGGSLPSATTSSNLTLSVSCTVFALTAASAGLLTVNASVILLGAALGN